MSHDDRLREAEAVLRERAAIISALEAARAADEERRLAVELERDDLRRRVAELELELAHEAEGAAQKKAPKSATYARMIGSVWHAAKSVLPVDAVPAVVNKGDTRLLDLDRRSAMHFPQGNDGEYSGYYPVDSDGAVAQVERARTRGATHLVVPSTAFWWLEFYEGLQAHLDETYFELWRDSSCVIYDLSSSRPAPFLSVDRTRSPLHDVVCFSVIDWDFRFQRPQQLLTQFARAGHRVFYIETTFTDQDHGLVCEAIDDNIYGVRLAAPPGLNVYRDDLDEFTLRVLSRGMAQLRDAAGITDCLSLVHLPFWAPLVTELRRRYAWPMAYDCMDDHSGFSTNTESMLQHEQRLIEDSDLVITTSTLLSERCESASRALARIPNAADFHHFSALPFDHPLGSDERVTVGYYGAIAEWFDVQMIAGAARLRPDWRFVLIGHTFGADLSAIESLDNVDLVPEQTYEELPSFLQDFDVALIPFLLTPLTSATNPVKFYEYLAAGKPVVATPLPELQAYSDAFYPATDANELVAQVERALAEDSEEARRERQEIARANTWESRYEDLTACVAPTFPKVAIVIVSFFKLDYLELCLQSIFERTHYPNYEVIVVDNGSDEPVVEYLRKLEASEPRLRVIFNGANLGFAKANNIGIAAADDAEHFVLLNDDTIVTTGWLSKLVDYLRNPEVGLVGPVTNWAGNEARIEPGYSDVADLESFAQSYTTEHAGEHMDIAVAALFCTAFSRALIDDIGVLDERYAIGMFEDDDFSKRVRQAGRRVVCAEDIYVHHWGRASFEQLDQDEYNRIFEENRQKYEDKWGEAWTPHKWRSA